MIDVFPISAPFRRKTLNKNIENTDICVQMSGVIEQNAELKQRYLKNTVEK